MTLSYSIRLASLAAVCALVVPAALPAQRSADRFTRQDVMLPVRDGVRLNTEIYVPKAAAGPLPIILTRTPYGLGHDPDGFNPALATSYRELAEDGYIFAFQDIRGRFKSEGRFVMLRPPREPNDPRGIDEGTDTYDTIEWLLKNVPGHNGRVGMLGISYGGWLTVMAMLDPHPALKAVSPQASPADMWLGDDFHHNGAFRLSYGFEYATLMETTKETTPFTFGSDDTYDWFLRLGSLANVNGRYLQGNIPTWNDYAQHPDYDAFWQRQGVARYLTRVTVPTLNVAGWWDQEDFYGPLRIYQLLERHDDGARNRLVVGPWNHGGWARGDGDALGRIRFRTPTAKYYRDQVQRPWFAHYLRGGPDPALPEALVFETGANRWRRYDAWPPAGAVTGRRLYFQAGGRLSFEPPRDTAQAASDSYVSDPARPVPYRARPIAPLYGGGSSWPIWLVDDQRHVDLRPDVLSWETEPLGDDVVVSGNVMADLFVSTTGTDGDWIVKLIDVYPPAVDSEPGMGGYELMVANEVMRARYRNGWEKPEPLVAGAVTPLTVDMRQANHRFRKGHRIMIQVQSTWFPLIDRNPQTFVPNIFAAKDTDFRAATQRIYRSTKYPSSVILPGGPVVP